jgi:hypothetical protein
MMANKDFFTGIILDRFYFRNGFPLKQMQCNSGAIRGGPQSGHDRLEVVLHPTCKSVMIYGIAHIVHNYFIGYGIDD